MNDDEIRALVRSAIQKHLGGPPMPPVAPAPGATPGGLAPISFARYAIGRPPDEAMCLIEPAVRCDHCGYCQCHGH